MKYLIALAALPALLFSPPGLAAAPHEEAPIKTRAYSTPALLFALRTDTQTLARLTPVLDPSFDFVPGPREDARQGNGYRHLGDLALTVRTGNGAERTYTSFEARRPIHILPAGRALAAADISASMGAEMGASVPLAVERRWLNERGTLVLRFTLINRNRQPVQVVSASMPMVFEQQGFGASAKERQASSSTVKPRPGAPGSVEVARANGQPPALRLQPDGRTPLDSWQAMPGGQLQGEQYASWVTSGFTLKPGAKRDIGVRFVIQPQGATR